MLSSIMRRMRRQVSTSRTRMTFGVGDHSVDLRTYLPSLMHHGEVLRRSALHTYGDDEISIQVEANEPGSLDVILSIAADNLNSIIAMGTLAATVTGTAAQYYTLKNESKKSGDIKSIDQSGDTFIFNFNDSSSMEVGRTVYELMIDEKADTSSSKLFATLASDGEVKSIAISSDDNTESFIAERDDFHRLSQSVEQPSSDLITAEESMTLKVTRAMLGNPDRTWEFQDVTTEVVFSALVTDSDFIRTLPSRTFTTETIIKARVEVKKKWLPEVETYQNESYKIVKVYDLINLDFDQSSLNI